MPAEHRPRLVKQDTLWVASCYCGWQRVGKTTAVTLRALAKHWLNAASGRVGAPSRLSTKSLEIK